MSDPKIGVPRTKARRGKTFTPKRHRREESRAVLSADGQRVLAVVHGRHVTPEDLDQALQCLLSAPNRTWDVEALRGQ
ncbi:hypothetical protein [Sphaerimonospora thailandensis]|uniref:Uncharacterized protein n=1 Tax=Sphaerimonospora thailandensis TaxID=795644 RepID=A0A8J3R723_9ACTN|nr:hypothetical protein [Sphaerimonospora thailandensis]GIH70297.1 hypothetical protein Mth01_25500 [Sphaerimonospora thailandensis]